MKPKALKDRDVRQADKLLALTRSMDDPALVELATKLAHGMRAKAQTLPDADQKEHHADPRRTTFTELSLARLKVPKRGQRLHWDGGAKGQLGLSVLLSAGGTKTYRATFYLNRQPVSAKLGRVGEMDLGAARELTREYRKLAAAGIDPRKPKKAVTTLYADVVEQFIEHYAKPRQRTWDQTAKILKNCTPLLQQPMESITKKDVRDLLRGFIKDGHPYMAAVTRAWLKKLWRWAYEEDLVSTPLMEGVRIDFEKRSRDRVYSAAEIKTIWTAASQLEAIESGYIKLLILLAPRKTALACMRRSHLDDPDQPALWTTPFELTKARKTSSRKRVYLTPLPALAQRIIKGLPKDAQDPDRLFPGLPVPETAAGRPKFSGGPLTRRLVERGAPADFGYHAWRHTIATFLENAGRSEWERSLILNHGGTSVTAGYSHGHPLELKRQMLEQWAEHVERLVSPQGATLLR